MELKSKLFELNPAVYKNAAASPNILPAASIIPVNISPIAVGTVSLANVCHLVAPSTSDASFTLLLDVTISFSEILVMDGIFSILTDKAPASIEYPQPAILTKTNNPNIPITIDGREDIVSRDILINLRTGPSFAYSAK